ncbi:hypothetical protein ACHAXH_005098 [Discostella pseudostelligera]
MSTMEHDATDQVKPSPISTNVMQLHEYQHQQTGSLPDCTNALHTNINLSTSIRRCNSMTSMDTVDFEYRLHPPPLRPGTGSYNEDEIAKFRHTCDLMDQMSLHTTNSADGVLVRNNQGGQTLSVLHLASLEGNNVKITPLHSSRNDMHISPPEQFMEPPENDMPHTTLKQDIGNNVRKSQPNGHSYDMTYSSPREDASYHSISNSICIPVEGRLADLSDNEYHSADDFSDNEGGIEILAESSEEEYEESITREGSIENRDRRPQGVSTSQTIRTNPGIDMLSMYENDSIVAAAAALVNENFIAPPNGNESIDFEQLMHEADDHNNTDALNDVDGGESARNHRLDADQEMAEQSFWRRRNPFSLSNATTDDYQLSRCSTTHSTQQPPVRARSTHHDMYIVEFEILPSDAHSSTLEIRDVMDIMANMELLHLWFDPIPAIFETNVKDGSNESYLSPRTSPSNSLEDNNSNYTAHTTNRQYDGQWVEISTPPLKIPPGAWLSGCSRSIRIAFRSLIGFPARIRSMIFVERSCGRMGMTLGPYPDGLCNSGTMAHHTFRTRIKDEEEAAIGGPGSRTSRRCVVISDEVRLQRDENNDFNGTQRSCCLCFILRFILGFFERAILFRWYKPDLASYMQQTISSMEKLRTLLERGESAAYHGSELIMDDEEWQCVNDNRSLGTPLLG